MKYAFFDVDNTIYNGYTAQDLLYYLTDKKLIDLSLKNTYLQAQKDYSLRKINYNEISQIALNLVSLAVKDKDISTVQKFVEETLVLKSSFLNEWVAPVIKSLKESAFKIILISAGPDFFIEKISQILNADEFYATIIDQNNDIYTGVNPVLMNEELKTQVLNKILSDKAGLTLGFGDSTGDISMLEMVDKPFVVQNDHHSEMMKYAEEREWMIFNSPDQVIKSIEIDYIY